jgi:hypothetical protein
LGNNLGISEERKGISKIEALNVTLSAVEGLNLEKQKNP